MSVDTAPWIDDSVFGDWSHRAAAEGVDGYEALEVLREGVFDEGGLEVVGDVAGHLDDLVVEGL